MSYFMAMVFMDVYELAVLTFMFVRDKNTEVECNNQFGPNSPEMEAMQKDIDAQDIDGILTPEQREMVKAKVKNAISDKLNLNKVKDESGNNEE